MLFATLAGCKQNNKSTENNNTAQTTADTTTVVVYYFHGKQRCKTCIAVGDVAKQTVEKSFADNNKVIFTEINTSEKDNEALVEKYEVTWNALIIAKGENTIEITDQAFATAIGNQQALENLIKEEVNKRLQSYGMVTTISRQFKYSLAHSIYFGNNDRNKSLPFGNEHNRNRLFK
jgi:phosphoheptose isomerase